jgi:hypothetical protein
MIAKLNRAYAYPQGGAGILFSRFAVEELYRDYETYLEYCSRIPNDDRAMGIWMLKHNMSTWNSTNRWFVGHEFIGTKGVWELGVNTEGIGKCSPSLKLARDIRPFFHRLKEIGMLHQRGDSSHRAMAFGAWARYVIANVSENVFYFHFRENARICIGGPETRPGYCD